MKIVLSTGFRRNISDTETFRLKPNGIKLSNNALGIAVKS